MDGAAGILKTLPHRYPFLMVDRVLEVIPGRRAVAVKNITGDSYPAGPGVSAYPPFFLVEAMAQVGALAAAPADEAGQGAGPVPGYLAGLHGVEFGRAPVAGDRVVFTLEFEAKMGGLVRFRGTAAVGGEVAARSGLTFSAAVKI